MDPLKQKKRCLCIKGPFSFGLFTFVFFEFLGSFFFEGYEKWWVAAGSVSLVFVENWWRSSPLQLKSRFTRFFLKHLMGGTKMAKDGQGGDPEKAAWPERLPSLRLGGTSLPRWCHAYLWSGALFKTHSDKLNSLNSEVKDLRSSVHEPSWGHEETLPFGSDVNGDRPWFD